MSKQHFNFKILCLLVVCKSRRWGHFFFEFHPYSSRKKNRKKCFRNDTLGGFTGKILEIFGFGSIESLDQPVNNLNKSLKKKNF
jgi:hypothetical protein